MSRRSFVLVGAASVAVPCAVAAVLVAGRRVLGPADVAVILVVVVLGAAVWGGRPAGVAAALSAALSFDFFHTRPYLSLKIADRDDLVLAVLLLMVGLAVGELVVRMRAASMAVEERRAEVEALRRVSSLVAVSAGVDELVATVEAELTELLGLRLCSFEEPANWSTLPVLGPRGVTIPGDSARVLGRYGLTDGAVEVPLVAHGTALGRLVLEPAEPTCGISLPAPRRRVALAIADQLAAALAADPSFRFKHAG